MGQLYDCAAPELLTLALHLTESPAQAEDLVQEVFLQAMQECEQWDSMVSVGSWMNHKLLLAFEAMRERASHSTSLLDLSDQEQLLDLQGPATEAQLVELQERLNQALDSLPDRYSTVVRLLVQDGLNSEQVGEVLQLSAGTVRSQLSRGLDRLRKMLPVVMGLGLWSATQTRGSASPFEAMRARFMDEARVLPTSHTLASIKPWLNVAKLSGVGILILGSFFLGISLLSSDSSPGGAEVAHPPVAVATAVALVKPDAPALAGERTSLKGVAQTAPHIPIRISGAVVDENGQPLSDARVVIFHWEPWCELEEEMRIDDVHGYGLQTTTDSKGHYSLELLRTPPGPPTLYISAGDEYTEEFARFQSKFSHYKPLRNGENKIPATRLVPAGSVAGVLLQHDGTSAHPASFQISPGFDARGGIRFSVEKDGSFLLEHVPTGIHTMRLAQGGAVLQTTINVRRGVVNRLPAVTFPKPIPLKVRVIDGEGLHVDRAMIEFHPINPAQRAFYHRYQPGDEGFMDVELPTVDQHEIMVTASGYLAERATYQVIPGEPEVVVQMRRRRTIKVRATDVGSGELMKRFTLRVQDQLDGCWVDHGRPLTGYTGKDGTKDVPYRSGGRCVVARSGFQDAIFAFDAGCTDLVDIPMFSSPQVRGRLMRGGVPIANHRLEVCPVEVGCAEGGDLKALWAQVARGGEHVWTDDPIWAETDGDGRFAFAGNSRRRLWYRIRASDMNNNAVEHWFQVPFTKGPTHDLDDLELAPAGTVRGKVQVPSGVNAAGLVFFLDLGSGTHSATTDQNGEFEFECVAPGKHFLRLQAAAGLAPFLDTRSFFLEPNQVLEQEVDLRSLGLSSRHLVLTEDGVPLAYHRVHLCLNNGADGLREGNLLGVTDAAGNVTGELPADGIASVWVEPLSGGNPRKHPTALVSLTCKASPPIEVDF